MKLNLLKSVFCLSFLNLLIACAPQSPEMDLAELAHQSGELEDAHWYYLKVLEKEPNNAEAAQELKKLNQRLAAIVLQKVQGQLASTENKTALVLRENLEELEAARKYDPDGKVFTNLLAEIKLDLNGIDSDNRRRGELIDEALNTGNIPQALTHFNEIHLADPESELLQRVEDRIIRAYLTQFTSILEAYLKAGKLPEANADLEKLPGLGFSGSAVKLIRESYNKFVTKTVPGKVDKNINAGSYYKAYLSILNNGLENQLGDRLALIKSGGARFYFERAKEYVAQEKMHRAFLEVLKGHTLDPEHSGIAEVYGDTRVKLQGGLQKFIAISGFGSPRNKPNLGPRISDELIARLWDRLPYGITIRERQEVDIALTGKRQWLKEVCNLLNVDLIVTGKVSLIEVDRHKSERTGVIRFQTGSEKGLNPAYLEWLRNQAGDPPPKHVAVPIYGNGPYRAGKVRLIGVARATMKMFDAKKGAITYAKESHVEHVVDDEFQFGIGRTVIDEDPLKLPSEVEIIAAVESKLVKQLADVVLIRYGQLIPKLIQAAKDHINRKEVEAAMKPLAEGFLYASKSKSSLDNSEFRELRSLLIQCTEK